MRGLRGAHSSLLAALFSFVLLKHYNDKETLQCYITCIEPVYNTVNPTLSLKIYRVETMMGGRHFSLSILLYQTRKTFIKCIFLRGCLKAESIYNAYKLYKGISL